MKFGTLIFLFIISLIGCQNSKVENDLTRNELNGAVKKITVIPFQAVENFGKIEKIRKTNWGDSWGFSYYFNKDGFLYKKEYLGSDFTIDQIENIKYDDNGNKIEVNGYNSDYDQNYKWIATYDEFNRIEKEIEYAPNGEVESEIENTYDANGNKIKISYFEGKDVLSYVRTYVYDENNNEIEFKHYKGDGGLDMSGFNKYDSNNNKIEYVNYNAEGKIIEKSNFKYDEFGNNIEFRNESYIYREPFLDISVSKMKFDKEGNEIELRRFDKDNNLESVLESKYDDFGNIIEQTTLNSDFEITHKREYVFDSYGNIVKETFSKPKSNYKTSKEWKFEYDEEDNWIIKKGEDQYGKLMIIERQIEYQN